MLKTACIQMTSTPDMAVNLKAAAALIREAVGQGAQFIATPENTDVIRHPAAQKATQAKPQSEHEGVAFFSALAKELEIDLLIGSLAVKHDSGKIANRSFLFNPHGQITATYDKIHLFDVDLATGECHRESETVAAGEQAVVAPLSHGAKIGLSVCYDVRFAYLYRSLAQNGAQILCVPAAFTVPTGMAHWAVLLRARAIETGSFVIAPAQVGTHENGRRTYGHAMIISPWGDVMARAGGDTPEIISANIDLSEVVRVRRAIPSLQHDRDYSV
jgi:predicted amidohydrolase